VKLARGDLVALNRVALAVKLSHVLEKAAGDFGRKFERGALDHPSSRAARAKAMACSKASSPLIFSGVAASRHRCAVELQRATQ
jgi:hypothetical protein